MEEFVELEHNGKKIYAEKNPTRKYIFKYIRDCTDEENRVRSHSRARNYPGGYYVMRLGYYRITEIFNMKIDMIGNQWVAKVTYKENSDDPFVDIPDPMRLQPLFNFISVCNEKLLYKGNPMGLINKEIHISSSELVDTVYNGEDSISYKVNWSIVK